MENVLIIPPHHTMLALHTPKNRMAHVIYLKTSIRKVKSVKIKRLLAYIMKFE